MLDRSYRWVQIAAVLTVLFLASGELQARRLVGMYTYAFGSLSATPGGSYPWPDRLKGNPLFQSGQPYYTDTPEYINYTLDSTAAMGVDFLLVDLSNGIHHYSLKRSTELLFEIADDRILRGIPTPRIALMMPRPGTPNAALNDNDTVYNNFVSKDGYARPSYFWMNGRPLWALYTTEFPEWNPGYNDSRYTIRYICNSGNNKCRQEHINSGVVWAWGTLGNDGAAGCPESSRAANWNNNKASCPLTSSTQITIQQGYQNIIPCYNMWRPLPGQTHRCTVPNPVTNEVRNCDRWLAVSGAGPTNDGACAAGSDYGRPPFTGEMYAVGFSPHYYNEQWEFAKARLGSSGIVLINSWDGIEGGWIQARVDYSRPDFTVHGPPYQSPAVFEDITRAHVVPFKGTLALANDIGPPAHLLRPPLEALIPTIIQLLLDD